MLRLLVDIRFQVLFHSAPAVLFTFPSRYYALSVVPSYFALDGGPPCFPQGFTCLVVLWIPARWVRFRLPEFHRLRSAFPDCSTILPSLDAGPQPRSSEDVRFGLFPVRSPLLRESPRFTHHKSDASAGLLPVLLRYRQSTWPPPCLPPLPCSTESILRICIQPYGEQIAFDYSSSGYLDVSVHQVCLPFGWYNITRTGLPHSEIHGSKPTCGSP